MGQPDGIRLQLDVPERAAVHRAIAEHGARAIYDACLEWMSGRRDALARIDLKGRIREQMRAALERLPGQKSPEDISRAADDAVRRMWPGEFPEDAHCCALVLGLAQQAMADDIDTLNRFRRDYEGDKRIALMLAIQECGAMGWAWPVWVSNAVRHGVEKAIATNQTDDLPALLFGRATPGGNIQTITDEALLQCFEHLEVLKATGQLHAPDGGRANVTRVLCDFYAWHAGGGDDDQPGSVSENSMKARIKRARARRDDAPGFVAIGYELPMMAFLSTHGYWRAKPAKARRKSPKRKG